MPDTFTTSAYDPAGKQHHKKISLRKYTKEQAEYIGLIWKKHIQDGKDKNAFKMPVFSKSVEEDKESVRSSEDEKEVPKSSYFKFKSIDSLQLPTNGGASFALIGSTRSGKSTAMVYLWEKYFKKHITFLMTLSKQADIYKPLQKVLISCGYKKELISEPMKLNRETNNKYDFCLIFDDLATDGKNADEMTKLLTIGRNSAMSAILCGQKMTMLNATGRSNCNYILCFKQNTDSAVKDTVETYLRSYFPPAMSVSEMCRVYKELTQDHQFLCIDTLNDEVFLSKIKIES
jgi:hypothetical protein